MKKLSIILAIFLALVTTGCSIKINGKEFTSIDINFEEKNLVEKTEVKELQLEAQNSIKVSNARGEIVFQKGDKPVIQVTAVKKLKDLKDQEKQDKQFEKLKIITNTGSKEIDISVDYIDGFEGLNYQTVYLNVTVPENIKIINADSASGNIKMKDLSKLEELKLSSASGSIEAANQTVQNYDLGTSSGSIKVEAINGKGSLHSVSGSLNMNKMNGELSCRTTSGSINSDMSILKVNASTVSGGINMNDEYIKADSKFSSVSGGVSVKADRIDTAGIYNLNSTSGGVNMSIPENTGFILDSKTVSGNISCDFEITLNSGDNSRRNKLSGTVGVGGPEINIGTTSGGIRINRN